MKEKLIIGDVVAQPGSVVKGSLGSVELADGSQAMVPVIAVNGAYDGPVLAAIAAIHGTEIVGVRALQQVVQSLNPREVHGAFLAVPGGNPLAIRAGTYTTPIDNKNLSGPWYLPPVAKETATITQRLAIRLNEVLETAEYVIDVHANPWPALNFVLTSFAMCKSERVRQAVEKMAKAFGLTIIDWPRKQATSIRDICCQADRAAITVEIEGNIWMKDEFAVVGARGIRNVMRAIGMLDGPMEKQEVKVIEGDLVFFGWLIAQRGGFVVPRKKPGELIKKGEPVIEIVNVYGEVIEEVKMPITGYCWAFIGGIGGTYAVSEGDRLAYVFTHREELGNDSWFVEKII